MLIIGLVLIGASVVLGAGAVFDGGESVTVEVLGATFNDVTVAVVFFAGALTMLLFFSGLWLLTSSMGRARRKRGERKESKRRQHDSVARLEEERTQLRAENERLSQQLGHGSDGVEPEGAETRVEGAPAERGAHSRDEADPPKAEASSTGRSRDQTDPPKAETSSTSRSRDGQV